MTKPNKVKELEKGVEECKNVTEATAGEAVAKSRPTTNEDLMSAISALNKTVDQRLGELSSALSNLSSTLTEEAVQAHEGCIESLGRLNAKMAAEAALIQAKLEDLESHRSAKPVTGNRLQAIIVRLHHLQVKELVQRLARQKAPLCFKGNSVQIYPDLTSGMMKKRQVFNDVMGQILVQHLLGFLHKSEGVELGFVVPSLEAQFRREGNFMWVFCRLCLNLQVSKVQMFLFCLWHSLTFLFLVIT